jgi:hypothetical protein
MTDEQRSRKEQAAIERRLNDAVAAARMAGMQAEDYLWEARFMRGKTALLARKSVIVQAVAFAVVLAASGLLLARSRR